MIITDKIVTDEGIFKTNGRPLGKSEDVRNYIERHSERYLIAENSWDEWEEWFEEFLDNVNEQTDPKLIEWTNFRSTHVNQKCVWDKETGNMFTIN